mmetsp:Transcript_9209/g.20540  ORF Transcript_9209/g.20540 Transcript_9209/m.20540 type:complete len:209 (+) Transcript_9209:32-658(+)
MISTQRGAKESPAAAQHALYIQYDICLTPHIMAGGCFPMQTRASTSCTDSCSSSMISSRAAISPSKLIVVAPSPPLSAHAVHERVALRRGLTPSCVEPLRGRRLRIGPCALPRLALPSPRGVAARELETISEGMELESWSPAAAAAERGLAQEGPAEGDDCRRASQLLFEVSAARRCSNFSSRTLRAAAPRSPTSNFDASFSACGRCS